MDNQHEVELNFFYLHYNDAGHFVEQAKEEKSKLRSFYARHAILSFVFSIEAMINKIINDFYILPTGRDSFQKLSLKERVFAAPLVCGRDKPIGKTLDQSKEPFQSFSELVDIRNWFVHPRRGNFIDARREFGDITTTSGENVPWVETDFSKVWPHTRIPVNPFELEWKHANQALKIIDGLITEMKGLFNGLLTQKWFDEITMRTKDGTNQINITTHSLWGGYTPKRRDTFDD